MASSPTWPSEAITEDEGSLLGTAGFTQSHASSPYVDFERHPIGFGKAGDDRVERVTLVDEPADARVWYGSVFHHDKAGEEWYYAEQPTTEKIPMVLATTIGWLFEDRLNAPRHPRTKEDTIKRVSD